MFVGDCRRTVNAYTPEVTEYEKKRFILIYGGKFGKRNVSFGTTADDSRRNEAVVARPA